MKITFKRIILLLLIVTIGSLAGVYFFTGLKGNTIDLDNIEFVEEEFIDFSSSGGKGTDLNYYRIDNTGKIILENDKPIKVDFNNSKVIGLSDKYVMLFDEETTIARVVKKLPDDNASTDYSGREVIYQTASNESDSTGANLTVRYAEKSSGKIKIKGLDTNKYSTNFENSLTGQLEKHYKLRYVYDDKGSIDGVQILYEIGKFSANFEYFPAGFEKMDYTKAETEAEQIEIDMKNSNSLEDRFRGNTILSTRNTPHMENNEIKYYTRSFTGAGFTYSEDAANYIQENNLATVTEEIGYWKLENINPEFYNSYGVHINTKDSPVTINPFLPNEIFQKIVSYYGETPKDAEFADHDVYSLTTKTSVALSLLYNYLYTSSDFMDISTNSIPILDELENPIKIGGFHARDVEGNFLYNEDGTPQRQLYTLDLVAQDNAFYGVETATTLERFQVGLQFKLTDQGILATIMGDTLRDADYSKIDKKYKHGFIMYAIEVLPELTTIRDELIVDEDGNKTIIKNKGMMIIPDGSGAIINFSNDKAIQNYSPYNVNVYGYDRGFVQKSQPEQTQTLMFGMYAFVDEGNNRGLMNVVEKGAAQSNLKADTPRGSSLSNYIFYTTTVRQNEVVEAGSGWYTTEFIKWASDLSKTDLQYNYMILEENELSYVGVANKYRKYLIDRYDLKEKDTTTDNVVDINFLGAFERYSMLLGIKYMTADSLTTFDQAQEVVQELLNNKVKNMSVTYTGWTKNELEYETTDRLKVSNALGKAKGMKDFNNYLSENNINFYPELFVGSSKGYDYAYGNMKYTAKSVGNFYARQYPFDLSTLKPDKKLPSTYYLNPMFYEPVTTRLLKSYNKFNFDGATVMDLGNFRIGSYNKNNNIYPHESSLYQAQTLAQIEAAVKNIKVSAPFDYALPYVDQAIDIPMTASAYGIFDLTIPFYQLVVSGLFDYTTETVNGLSDKSLDWYFVKALETGSNLRFIISYEDPVILSETDYTQYFRSFYQNWRDNIIDINSRINDAGIHNGNLVNHETIEKDITKVTYSNELVLVINSSPVSYKYNGINIDSYSYIKLGGK